MKKSLLRNQRGQFVIEGLLLMVVLLSVFVFLSGKIKESGIVSQMVTGPWSKIAGMTETGTWQEAGPAARESHPNSYNRIFTPDGT